MSLAETRDLALEVPGAHGVPRPAAATTVLGEVCATLATAKPDAARPPAAMTPPPTETGPSLSGPTDRHATALVVGFATGLLATILFVLPRPRRRRD